MTLASFGNIGDTLEERLRFWELLEEHERAPRSHKLHIMRDQEPEIWRIVDTDPDAPPELAAPRQFRVKIARSDAARYEQYIEAHRGLITPGESPARIRKNGPTTTWLEIDRTAASSFWNAVDHDPAAPAQFREASARNVELNDADAIRIQQYLVNLRRKLAKKSHNIPFYIEPGRGGHVQMRLIAALPFELPAADRLKLVQEFCEKEFARRGVPFWAVIHAPNGHNDPRNTHFHVAFSEQPARKIPHPETGEMIWDFTYAVKTRNKYRNVSITYPFKQKKNRDFNSRDWPQKTRAIYASIVNKYLKNAGITKRYDPRSYEEMGIQVDKSIRISPKEYTLEKRGISTPGGKAVIDLQWKRYIDDLSRRHDDFSYDKSVDLRFREQIEKWKSFPVAHMMTTHRNRWRQAAVFEKVYAAEFSAVSVVIDKVLSKINPPIDNDSGPKNAEINKDGIDLINAFRDKELAPLRQKAAHFRRMRRLAEKYLEDVTEVRGPIIGNQVTTYMFDINRTTNPYTLKTVDALAMMIQALNQHRLGTLVTKEPIKMPDGTKVPVDTFLAVADAVGIGMSEAERRERGISVNPPVNPPVNSPPSPDPAATEITVTGRREPLFKGPIDPRPIFRDPPAPRFKPVKPVSASDASDALDAAPVAPPAAPETPAPAVKPDLPPASPPEEPRKAPDRLPIRPRPLHEERAIRLAARFAAEQRESERLRRAAAMETGPKPAPAKVAPEKDTPAKIAPAPAATPPIRIGQGAAKPQFRPEAAPAKRVERIPVQRVTRPLEPKVEEAPKELASEIGSQPGANQSHSKAGLSSPDRNNSRNALRDNEKGRSPQIVELELDLSAADTIPRPVVDKKAAPDQPAEPPANKPSGQMDIVQTENIPLKKKDKKKSKEELRRRALIARQRNRGRGR